MDTLQIVVTVGGVVAALVLLGLAAKVAELFLYASVMALGALGWHSVGGSWGIVVGMVGIVPGGIWLVRALWRIRQTQPRPATAPPKPKKDA